MRIVYIVFGADIAGGETVCFQIMRAARERGHVVCILVPEEGGVARVAREEGFEVLILPLQRTFHFQQAMAFRRFLRAWQADLVHTHTVLPGMILARIGAKLAGVPIICHVHLDHTFNRHFPIRFLQRLMDNFTAHFCTAIIAVSEDTQRALLNSGNPADKLCVIPNGVKIAEVAQPPASVDIYSRFGIPMNSKLIGCVARLAPSKGQRDLLLAGVEICQAEAEATFLFIGADMATGGQYAEELTALAEELKISEQVYFVGFQPDAPQLVETIDVFVLPSYREAMPMSILEAMAAGKPVVATNVNGISEVVVEGITGYLVPPGQPKALAASVLILLRNPDKACEMGLAGRRRIEEHFDVSKLHERIFTLYDRVMAHYHG